MHNLLKSVPELILQYFYTSRRGGGVVLVIHLMTLSATQHSIKWLDSSE
jgi:hypothetical protein